MARAAEPESLVPATLVQTRPSALEFAKLPSRLILVAGRPLNEPIARYGPFVMNTMDEIERAVRDYQSGQFP